MSAPVTTSVELRAVSKVFDPAGRQPTAALTGVSTTFGPGGIHLVWGPSGSGKTTLLTLVGALDDPTSGEVVVGGRALSELTEPELAAFRRTSVGFLFQRPLLFPRMPIWANVSISLVPDGVSPADRRARAMVWLARFGLDDKADRPPEKLSGGEVQRAMLARALLRSPAIVLLDEPTSQLDQANARQAIAAIREVASEGRTVIVTSHDPEVRAEARWITELRDGSAAATIEVSP